VTNDDKARWSRLVSDWESTDLSQGEFARERGISVHSLRYWLYQLRREAKASVPSQSGVEKSSAQSIPKNDLRLLPVRAVASAPKARQQVASREFLELVLPSGRCVRFQAGTDLRYLRALVAVL
jgi:transposase-like protein